MLTQITDLRLCALMSLGPYVHVPLCLRPYVVDRDSSTGRSSRLKHRSNSPFLQLKDI